MSRNTNASVAVRLGPDAWVGCHSYPDSGPILYVTGAGSVSLTLHVARHGAVDVGDVVNARKLLVAVTTYLAECERVYHQTHPHHQDDPAGDPDRPTGPGDGAERAA